jgi:hypothetical protein
MCFDVKPPELKALPQAPSVDDTAVRQREAEERARLLAAGGTAGTVKTDLAPEALTGQRKVLLGV